jgi:agmatinase
MFANVFSYMGVPLSRDVDNSETDVVVMGIPYDLATSGRAGTRSGPMGIRRASANLSGKKNAGRGTFQYLIVLLLSTTAMYNFTLATANICWNKLKPLPVKLLTQVKR